MRIVRSFRLLGLAAAAAIAAGTLTAPAAAAPAAHAGTAIQTAGAAPSAVAEVRYRQRHGRHGAQRRHHAPRWGHHRGHRGPRWGHHHRFQRAQSCIRTQRLQTRFGTVVRRINVCR